MAEYLLYDKTIKLSYTDNGHRYTVQSRLPDNSWGEPREVWGVTTILSILAKPALINWSAGLAANYFLEALSDKPSPSLAELRKIAAEAKRAHTLKKDTAGSIGTAVHAEIENFLKGHQNDLTNTRSEVGEAVQAFTSWWLGRGYSPILVEQPIYSLRSHYAGTLDLLFKDGEATVLGDIKTSNTSRWAPDGVYVEYFAQLGAYAKALYEMQGKLPDELVIINAGKDGVLRTVWGRDFGMTVDDAVRYWDRVHGAWGAHKEWSGKMKG